MIACASVKAIQAIDAPAAITLVAPVFFYPIILCLASCWIVFEFGTAANRHLELTCKSIFDETGIATFGFKFAGRQDLLPTFAAHTFHARPLCKQSHDVTSFFS